MSNLYPSVLKYKTARSKALAEDKSSFHGRECPQCHTHERDVTNGRCVKCRADGNTYYSRNTEDQKEKMRQQSRRKWKENREQQLWQQAKYRAGRDGRKFDLAVSDIVIPDLCPVLGITMNSPSLDRKDNDKGYVKDNVFVISRRANVLKGAASIEELEAILAYMRG